MHLCEFFINDVSFASYQNAYARGKDELFNATTLEFFLYIPFPTTLYPRWQHQNSLMF